MKGILHLSLLDPETKTDYGKIRSMIQQFLATEILIIELLLSVSIVAIVVWRLRIPYTVALVIK
jgi:hypothetical protein